MIAKLEKLAWYLKQPKGSQLILNRLKQKTYYKSREKTRKESENWCRLHAVDNLSAMKQLFSSDGLVYEEIEKVYPDEFREAELTVRNTPFKMGGAGNLSLLFNVCNHLQAKFVIETGVAYGWSSFALLLSLSKRPGSRLISIDMPYPTMGNEAYVGVVVPKQLKPNWTLIREPDISGLPKALKLVPHLDLVHYDSDKSYLGRMFSYPKLYEKLRAGGIFISDDINDNLAFKDFCEELKVTPVITSFEEKYVGAFVKK